MFSRKRVTEPMLVTYIVFQSSSPNAMLVQWPGILSRPSRRPSGAITGTPPGPGQVVIKIAGAGLDVFDIEPLPLDHPYRKMDNVVLTPHLGYVSQQNYQRYYPDIVEDIRGFLAGKPVRVVAPR